MSKDLILLSKALMRSQTRKNAAPAWALTEIAINKGEELSDKYGVDKRLVLTSLYLAHTVFNTEYGGKIQSKHEILSSKFVTKYLKSWNVSENDQKIILNAILAHHNKIVAKSLVARVVKNAECYKFITLNGSKVYFKELKKRGYTDSDARKIVIKKMYSKKRLLTLPECKNDATNNCKEIITLFKNNIKRD